MHIRECTNQEEWNTFLTVHAGQHHALLQSWEWGDFQKSYGRDVYRLLVEHDGTIVAAVHLQVMHVPLGRTYLFSARGPVFIAALQECGITQQEVYTAIISSEIFAEIAGRHSAIFWRFEPVDMPQLPRARRTKDITHSETTWLSLAQGTDALLSAMKQKTRYNIRLAAKKGVEVTRYAGADTDWKALIDEWWTLLEQTSTRHGIHNHPRAYYTDMFEQLGAKGVLEITQARHEGDLLAMNIILTFGDTVTYLHGASTHHKKKLMAPYALQWEAIQDACASGYAWYDFSGISSDPQNKLSGVTRFKRGFGGEEHHFAGTWDFPIQPLWYSIYRTIRYLRSL